jgi:hypothetical protein
MARVPKIVALVLCAVALVGQWSVIAERITAAVWNWYKFWGYGGFTPLVVGRQAQLLFYFLSLAFASVALLVSRTSKDTWHAIVARWQLRGFALAIILWTAVLVSPLVAPFGSWR